MSSELIVIAAKYISTAVLKRLNNENDKRLNLNFEGHWSSQSLSVRKILSDSISPSANLAHRPDSLE